MKYLATIKGNHTSSSMLFTKLSDAEQWIDANNNNMENTSMIETFDDDWQKLDGFIYTKEKE